MPFYDLAHQTALHGYLWKQLGFEKIESVDKIKFTMPTSKGIEGSICAGPSGEQLNIAAKHGPKAIIITDSRIDRKLIATMQARNIMLCIPFDRIVSSSGLRRSSSIYLASKLAAYAMKKKIKVAFISLASSEEMLCSPIQLIELAKLLGASEEQARVAIAQNNLELIS